MNFSLYTEVQHWARHPRRVYAEVMDQVVHADRLGYHAYCMVEHFFFPKFSISADPLAFFTACAQHTQQIRFRTLLHVLPLHNPAVLASRIAEANLLLDGRYEFGVARGHAWEHPKAGVPVTETRDRYEESLEILLAALEDGRFSHDGRYYAIRDSAIVPSVDREFRLFLGGTSNETYVLAGERGWAMVVPPLLPYEILREPLDLYRDTCAKHGHEPYIVWIHACYLDEDRDTARREAELGMRRFLQGNASPLTEHGEIAPAEELEAAGYGFYAQGILEKLAETPYEEMIEGDIVWVGTPGDIIERIEGVREECEGLSEIAIAVNAGGTSHWQAIKAQEIFADHVIPHFRHAPVGPEAERASVRG